MSKQLHKSYRSVLKIDRRLIQIGPDMVPLTVVYWCIVDRRTSRSVYSRHWAATVYVGSVRHHGIEARIPGKPIRVTDDKLVELVLRDAISHAAFSYLGGKEYTGTIRWESGGYGSIDVDGLNIALHFYACNVIGANSAYHELVSNVDLKQGDRVRFQIHADPYVSLHCGATKIERVAS